MELNQLNYFVRIAQLGSFTRAAEDLAISQPSLSQQIAKLERELGQPLFERLGRGIRLTEPGRVFKQRADQILELVDRAKSSVVDSPDRGRIIIAAIPTIAPYLLPGLLHAFAVECPKAQLEIREEVTAVAVRKCLECEVDLALLALPVQGDALQVVPLFTEELLAVFPADHPLTAHEEIDVADLIDQPFILLNEAHCLTGTALGFCHRRAFSPVIASQTQQLVTIQELVRLGRGISLVPEMAVRADTNPGRAYRRIRGERPTRLVGVIWNKLRFHSQLFHRFVRFLRRYHSDGTTSQPPAENSPDGTDMPTMK